MNRSRTFPLGFGGKRTAPDVIKRDGWHNQGTLVIDVSDQRLTWPERETIEGIGDRLYGVRTITSNEGGQ